MDPHQRFNPFSPAATPNDTSNTQTTINQHLIDDPFSANPTFAGRQSANQMPINRQTSLAKSTGSLEKSSPFRTASASPVTAKQTSLTSRYTTSFPDPFGDLTAADEDRRGSGQPPQSPPWTQRSLTMHQPAPHRPLAAGESDRSNGSAFHEGSSGTPVPRTSLDADRGEADSKPMTTSSRQTGSGLGSFLSRATSVTSSTVTDKVSGAVGSMRSAVDSLSNQIQSAVPNVNLSNERLSSDATSAPLTSPAAGTTTTTQQQQQLSAASYLASKLSAAASSATGSSTTASGLATSPVAISRQRVVLILESPAQIDWPLQFLNYRRALSGLAPVSSINQSSSSSASSTITSFFTSATAQFSSSAAAAAAAAQTIADGSDLIEQVDYRDVSMLANQTSSTVAVSVRPSALTATSLTSERQSSTATSSLIGGQSRQGALMSQQSSSSPMLTFGQRIIRPEFIVVRQRAVSDPSDLDAASKASTSENQQEHLKNIVKALEYSAVPMFEPYQVWHTFQDRQLIFAHLLRIQKRLGKENFPLIPQVYCQTGLDLLNYIANSQSLIPLPCLLRIGAYGKAKIRCDSMQMLRDFANILITNNQSCTLEQYLDVKCDLVVQRIGSNLRLFRKNVTTLLSSQSTDSPATATTTGSNNLQSRQTFDTADSRGLHHHHHHQPHHQRPLLSASGRPMATRQSSLSSSMLSSLISGSQQQQQQQQHHYHQQQQYSTELSRRNSLAAQAYERLSEVSYRYRNWIDGIGREFEGLGLQDVYYLKICVATNDREYIVGIGNSSSIRFLGSPENQDEDKRNFVDLIVGQMNAQLSNQHSATTGSFFTGNSNDSTANGTPTKTAAAATASNQTTATMPKSLLTDKKAFSNPSRQTTATTTDGYPSSMASPLSTLGSCDDNQLLRHQAHLPHHQASAGGGSMANRTQVFGSLNGRSKSVSVGGGGGGGGGSNQSSINDSLTDRNSVADILDASSRRNVAGESSSLTDTRSSLGGSSSGRLNQQRMATGGGAGAGHLHQRQSSLGQSFFDQTSTALSSFQKQSMSFFKRLDLTSASMSTTTPPQSAKSDTGVGAMSSFDHNINYDATVAGSGSGAGGASEIKSQSIDSGSIMGAGNSSSIPIGSRGLSSSSVTAFGALHSRELVAPPKPPPPPPQALMNRQSSLSSTLYSSKQSGGGRYGATAATPANSRQNSSAMAGTGSIDLQASGTESSQHRGKVVRQNSALSAFEPFDNALSNNRGGDVSNDTKTMDNRNQASRTSTEASGGGIGSGNQYDDSVSMTSAESNDTTTAEDTMNNLKKTFASIFGHE